MFSPNEIENIKREMKKLKENITLKFFTDFRTQEDGTRLRSCMACETINTILKTLESNSEGKLKIEEYSTIENEDVTNKFNIKRIPEILFLDDNGKVLIRYIATPTGPELVPFIETVQYYSGIRPFYQDTILTHLSKIPKSHIKLFMTLTCPYCPTVIPLLNMYSILSKGKITTEIIDINANPDVAAKYQVMGVPHTLINEKDQIYGMFTPQELLEKLTGGQLDFGGMYA